MPKKSISFESLSNVLTPLTHLINKKADKIALNDKAEKSAIITKLSEMIEDSDHRTVSDSNIDAWNNKSEFSGAYEDLSNLPTIYTDVVRYSSQSLSNTEKNTARTNIGAVGYESQSLTDAQKTQARTNIGAGTSSFSGIYSDLEFQSDLVWNVPSSVTTSKPYSSMKYADYNDDEWKMEQYPVEVGDRFTLTVDGIDYYCTVWCSGAHICIGNMFSGSTVTAGELNPDAPLTVRLINTNDSGISGLKISSQSSGTFVINRLIQHKTLVIEPDHLPTTVPVIPSATVGQTIVVKAVDENGKPTEWEAADMASGAGLPEGASSHQQLVTDSEGNAKWEDIPDPIQADYAQNDPEQPDYIKNRLAYSTREQVAHESVTIGIYNLGYATLPYEFFPGNGEEYAINWDGTDYTATAAITTVDEEEAMVVGNTSFFGGSTNTDIPFGIISRSGRALVYSSESGEHTISLTGYEQIPHKIPREYVDHNPIVGVIDSSYYNYRYLNPAKGASIAEVRKAAVEGNRDIIIRLDLDNWQGTLRYMGLTNVSTDGTNYVSALLFSTIKANNVSINDSDEAIDGTMQLEYWYALLEPTEGPPADAFVNFQFAEINLAPGTAKAGYYMRVNEKGLWEATEGISNVSELTNDAGYLTAPATASVGQTIIVKSVDENGKPTEWEAADMASGSGLPEGATAHQQLVTDSEGNAKWEDKLCYEGLTEIIHQQTITCEQEESGIYCGAVDGHLTTDMAGKTYKVRFNGIEYECEAVKMDGISGVFMGNMSMLGIPNSDTGEPFILGDQGNCLCFVTESGKYDICIIGSGVKIIDSKYLPSMSYAPYTEWETAVMVARNAPPLSPGTILNWNNGVMLVYGVEENSFYAYKFSDNMRCKYTIGDDGKWNETLCEFVE